MCVSKGISKISHCSLLNRGPFAFFVVLGRDVDHYLTNRKTLNYAISNNTQMVLMKSQRLIDDVAKVDDATFIPHYYHQLALLSSQSRTFCICRCGSSQDRSQSHENKTYGFTDNHTPNSPDDLSSPSATASKRIQGRRRNNV